MVPDSAVLKTLFATVVVSSACTLVFRRFALRFAIVARPRVDRWHCREVPLLGGTAMFAAMLLASAFLFTDRMSLLGWFAGSTIAFALGVVDDLRGMSAFVKLIGQIVAACVAAALGVVFQGVPPLLAVPLTLLWIVAVTNAFNLLDNMDGLAAGSAVISSLALFAQAWLGAEPPLAIPCIALAGAALGFLIFNIHPARIFMGDCGSMFLGFSLAAFSVMGSSSLAPNLLISLLFPCIILAVPLFDTSFVSLVRALNGRSLAEGGKDHTSHRLVFLGLPEARAVWLLWGLSAIFASLGLSGLTGNSLLLFVVAVLILIALIIFGVFLAQIEVYSSEEFERASSRHARQGKPVLSRVIQGKRRLAEAVMDFLLIIACFIAAFLLRYDGALSDVQQRALNVSLPLVVCAQLLSFYVCGVYSGLWRYAGIADVVVISKAVAIGTAVCAITLSALVHRVPVSVIINFGMLLLIAAAGSRILLRVLRHALMPSRTEGRRAFIVGAGDAGELALREIINNRTLKIRPLGFIDDNPNKAKSSIHGLRIVGDRSRLAHLVSLYEIEELIIAMPSVHNGIVDELVQFCQDRGLTYRHFNGILTEAKNGKPVSAHSN